jgi:uncharacterized membrane protein
MNASSHRSLWFQFMRSPQSRLFIVGSVMTILWVGVAAMMWQLQHPLWDEVLTLGFSHILVGKGMSVAQGHLMGMPDWLIIVLATYCDILSVLVTYPILIFSYENFIERHFFHRQMRNIFKHAEKGMNRFGRFRIVGVFAFVWAPLWMTGIIVGAVLGYLMGLPTWAIMSTVSIGAGASVVCWVFFSERLFAYLGWLNQQLPGRALIGIILIAIMVRLLMRRWKARKKAVAALRTPTHSETINGPDTED